MTKDAWRAFLLAGSRTAKVASVSGAVLVRVSLDHVLAVKDVAA